MEVGGALASALFAALSLPCLVLLLVLGEAGLRVASLALRGGGHGWPTRSAFLSYRIARPTSTSSSSYHHYSAFRDDDGEDEPPLPAECCDRLPLATFRGAAECAFCLCGVRDGDEVRELRCRHVFHRACIDAWLVRPRATCPLCRDRLLPADTPLPSGCGTFTAVDDDDDDGYFVHHGGALWHMT